MWVFGGTSVEARKLAEVFGSADAKVIGPRAQFSSGRSSSVLPGGRLVRGAGSLIDPHSNTPCSNRRTQASLFRQMVAAYGQGVCSLAERALAALAIVLGQPMRGRDGSMNFWKET